MPATTLHEYEFIWLFSLRIWGLCDKINGFNGREHALMSIILLKVLTVQKYAPDKEYYWIFISFKCIMGGDTNQSRVLKLRGMDCIFLAAPLMSLSKRSIWTFSRC
jgi:hypothetical protein